MVIYCGKARIFTRGGSDTFSYMGITTISEGIVTVRDEQETPFTVWLPLHQVRLIDSLAAAPSPKWEDMPV